MCFFYFVGLRFETFTYWLIYKEDMSVDSCAEAVFTFAKKFGRSIAYFINLGIFLFIKEDEYNGLMADDR